MKISAKRFPFEIPVAIILTALILAIYSQVTGFGFIFYDDPKYVRENPMVVSGLTLEGIRWAFSSVGYVSNWHPVTWISHMIDAGIFGLKPGGHHLVNVIIHIAKTLLLFLIFSRMTGEIWKGAVVAALFAVHPLHVESVAWIAERKDVLSAFWGLIAIWCYTIYVKHPDLKRYIPVLALYALSLMAKPMLVTLPFILLLLDFWPIRREELFMPVKDNSPGDPTGRNTAGIHWCGFLHLIREKVPLFVLAGISCCITYIAQNRGGSVSSLDLIPLGSRMVNAVTAYAAYLWNMIWPLNLAALKPDDPDVYYNMTCIYSRQARTDEAIGSINTALSKGFKDWNAVSVRTDPDLENIRGTDFCRNLIR